MRRFQFCTCNGPAPTVAHDSGRIHILHQILSPGRDSFSSIPALNFFPCLRIAVLIAAADQFLL
jgi:hypothetical protein